MSISTISIRRHIGTLMLTLAVIVLGVFFIVRLPVDLLPSITYPRIGVRVEIPGVSPEVGVDEVTKPLEEAFAATEGVTQVYSQTREGRISLNLYFQPGGDIDRALNDTTAAFNRARGRLPDTIESPRIFKYDPSQSPVYEFALTSPSLKGVDLRVFAEEDLARELGVVAGVAGVDVSGGVEEEIRINVDLNRLQALGIGLTDVLDELTNRNQDISGGRILGEDSEALTRTVGRFENADEIRNLAFQINSAASANSNISQNIYLRDFAQVIDDTEQQRLSVLLNKQPAVKISIQKQPDANTINVVDGVKQRLAELKKSGIIPEETLLTTTLDESQFIRNSINNVTASGLIGTALAAISVLLFLGSLRQTFIIVLAIPLATLAAIILMGIFGLSLNVFSLGGLALGVGIVVDNSIVMLENIAKGMNDGELGMGDGAWGIGRQGDKETRRQGDKETRGWGDNLELLTPNSSLPYRRSNATSLQSPMPNAQSPMPDAPCPMPNSLKLAEASSREVESALIASTSTNLVVVLPFLLVGGLISLLFNELILTISFAVAASILIAVTVVPMLTSRMLAWRFSSKVNKFWFLKEFNNRFEAATRLYGNFLRNIVQFRLLTIVVTILFLSGSCLWMIPQIPKEILPRINTGRAILFASFPPGTTLETNQKVMDAVDDILLKQPETEYAFSTVGGFIFSSTTIENPLRSSSNITLKSGTDIEAYTEKVNKEFNQLNLAKIRLRLFPGRVRGLILNNSPVRGADIDIILQGENQQSLEKAGEQVLTALDEQVKSARFRPDADKPQPEIQIRPDWQRIAALGLTTEDIGDTINTAIQGSIPTQLQRGNRLVDVRVQLDEASVQTASQLERLPLFVNNNYQVRLSDVASIVKGKAPGEIQRINQRQVYIIAGNLSEKANLSQALAQVSDVIDNLELPEGVRVLPSYSAESNQQLQNSLWLLGGLAAFLVFVVMAVQYNSLIDPLVIMFTMPLALAGGIFGLYITQTAIGATVIVGAVLLVGIVVNNAIVMVELANQIRQSEKCDRATAILKAAPQRLRPILMTTITTVLGMFPLALGIGEGSEFLQPLGVVVFSGLSLATVVTLFIIPCFYISLHDLFALKWIQVMGNR